MRVSTSLQNCDNCGNQLSKENHIGSYGAEPKRSRSDVGDVVQNNGAVNGRVSSMNGTTSSSPTSSSSAAAVPVPQALYVNRNAITTTENSTSVRPQAIYVNVNNATSTARSTSTTATAGTNSSNTATSQTALGTGTSQMTTRSAVSADRSSTSANMPIASANATVLDRNRLPLSNSAHSSSYPLQNQQLSSVRANAPGNFPATTPPHTASNPNLVTVLPNVVNIPAQQIRIGAQKFKPLTAVQFKEDGILFT